MSGVTANALRIQTLTDHTIIITALNACRNASGQWPANTTDLDKPPLPRDRSTGAAVGYQRNSDGSITLTSGANPGSEAIVTTVR